jgi:FkbM family methyltransferase
LRENATGLAELFRLFRKQFKRIRPEDKWLADLIWHCNDKKIETCFDIGANVGQFGQKLSKFGYTGTIVSFEPLEEAHQLLSKMAKPFPNWYVESQTALGDTIGTVEINVSANSHSSSILDPSAISIKVDSGIKIVNKESVVMDTLDNVVERAIYLDKRTPSLIKIDVQGYEDKVIFGASHTLSSARLVFVEMNLAPVYEGAAGFVDIYTKLENQGFECISLTPAFEDNSRHRMLQVDGLFSR